MRTAVGEAKIMSYEDIVEAKKKREEKEASKPCQARKTNKRKAPTTGSPQIKRQRNVSNEVAAAEREIATAGLADFCTVMRFDS